MVSKEFLIIKISNTALPEARINNDMMLEYIEEGEWSFIWRRFNGLLSDEIMHDALYRVIWDFTTELSNEF